MCVFVPADGAQERVAAGQDVSAVRRDQEEPRGHGRRAARGRLRVWSVHGGRALGHADRHDQRVAPQGAGAADAGYLHQGDPRGPAGPAQHVRVPGLQDQTARTDVRLDVQPQDQGEAGQVDARRRGAAAAGLDRRRRPPA